MRLPDPARSRIVLVGAGTYAAADLPDLPSVGNNLDALAAVLTDPLSGAFAAGNCEIVRDPRDARTVYRSVRAAAAAAEDTLLVYYAGHGFTGRGRGELYLGLTETNADELGVSGLPFELIREILLHDSAALNRVLILDCCFSGRAILDFMAGSGSAVLGQIDIEGTYSIASAPANAVAIAPVGARYTAFTGALLEVLRTGVAGGPELLTLGVVYRHLRQALIARGMPVPNQRGTDTADLLALVRNRAFHTAVRDDATAGTVILGRYALVERVPGMGRDSWRAVDRLLGRTVALQHATSDGSDGARSPERLLLSARAMATVRHSNVIAVHDVFHHEGKPWIVTEWLDGRRLADLILESGPLPDDVVARVAAAMLDALEAVHLAGVRHHNVSPQTINVGMDGRCVLAGFNIAYVPDVDVLDAPGSVSGKPHFMSPERAIGAPCGTPSDLFSLGCTLYLAIEGVPAFDGPQPVEVMRNIVDQPARPPERASPLHPLVAGLLVKNPAKRWTVARARRELSRP